MIYRPHRQHVLELTKPPFDVAQVLVDRHYLDTLKPNSLVAITYLPSIPFSLPRPAAFSKYRKPPWWSSQE